MSSTQRRLTTEESAELDALNASVTAAINTRREWLDTKMIECSRLQVGDDIYDTRTGKKLGVVSSLYRYWRDRDEGIRDTSMSCEYQYETSPRSFDNTSRQSGVSFGTREDAINHVEDFVRRLRAGLA